MDVSDPALAQQENDSPPPNIDPVSPAEPKPAASPRAEIDTSAPFESVKEAATRFGGFGLWRPASLKPSSSPSFQEFDAAKKEEEAAQLEMDLAAKETETLNVLKELETTKVILEELKLKLQEGGNNGGESPGLSESKRSLGIELAGVRAAIESCKEKVEEERLQLEETGQRLFSNSSKASSLEEELKETKVKLAAARRVKRAEEELRESKKALEEAASRVEVAEEVLLRRRRRRRRNRHYYDYYHSSSAASATLSIGQILRRKLQEAEEIERRKKKKKRKVSLGQLLSSTRLKDSCYYNDDDKQYPAKKKKKKKKKRFGGFSGISLLVTEQSKMLMKKKRQISAAAGFRCRDV